MRGVPGGRLRERLADSDVHAASVADVQGVLVSHIHPDHFGLAGRIREESGAWVGMHPADIELFQGRYVETGPLLEAVDGTLRMAGAPAEEMDALARASMPILAGAGRVWARVARSMSTSSWSRAGRVSISKVQASSETWLMGLDGRGGGDGMVE